MKKLSFSECLNIKIDIERIQLGQIKDWIQRKSQHILKFDDDIVVNYINEQLIANVDPKKIQLSVTPFFQKNKAKEFTEQLWLLLVSAHNSEDKHPDPDLLKVYSEFKWIFSMTKYSWIEIVEIFHAGNK